MGESAAIYFKIHPSDVNFVNRIIEGYEYFGVMSTMDKTQGIMMLRSTKGMRQEAILLLESLPEVIEIIDKRTLDSEIQREL